MSQKCHNLVRPFIPLVSLLAEMLGQDYEIVLHDISGPKPVTVALENSHLTGRTKDSPMTDFGRFLMSDAQCENIDYLANYPSESENGSSMRSGVLMIRDEGGHLVGFLCINYDTTRAEIVKDICKILVETRPLSFKPLQVERFKPPADEFRLIDIARQKFGKPLSFLSPSERRECVAFLYDEGFFSIKGSIPLLAKKTNKSPYTIYADLRRVREEQ